MLFPLPAGEIRLLPRKQLTYFLGFFVIGGLVAFSNIINSYFLSDDLAVLGQLVAGEFPLTWARSQGGFFRPLFTLSFFLDYKIWGLNPFGFHLTNILLHSLTAFLVFILSLRLVQRFGLSAATRTAVAFGAGILFLLHPSHTEVASWAAGRADALATLFSLSSMVWFLAYTSGRRRSHLVLALSSFALALLGKESAASQPFVILLLGFAVAGWSLKHASKVAALFALILLAYILVRSTFLGTVVGGYGSQHLNLSPGWIRDRIIQAELRSILPALPIEWSSVLVKPLKSRLFLAFAAICAAVIAALILLRRTWYESVERKQQNRFLLVLVLLFLISLLPAINLRLGVFDTLGERFVYLPSVFSCLIISYLLAVLIRNRMGWLVILICILGFYAISLYRTNQIWRAAAQLARTIQDDLVSSPSGDRLVILNAPDNLKGVPVYHNGLPEAVKYCQDKKHFVSIEVVSLHRLESSSDQVLLVKSSDLFTLTLVNEADTFTETHNSECAVVTTQAGNRLDVRRTNCAQGVDRFFFSQGRMIKLKEE